MATPYRPTLETQTCLPGSTSGMIQSPCDEFYPRPALPAIYPIFPSPSYPHGGKAAECGLCTLTSSSTYGRYRTTGSD